MLYNNYVLYTNWNINIKIKKCVNFLCIRIIVKFKIRKKG